MRSFLLFYKVAIDKHVLSDYYIYSTFEIHKRRNICVQKYIDEYCSLLRQMWTLPFFHLAWIVEMIVVGGRLEKIGVAALHLLLFPLFLMGYKRLNE